MTEYITQTDKNGKARYYRVEDGKKTAIKKTEYEAHIAAIEQVADTKKEDTTTTTAKKPFKQSRWVKVHEQGQANFESKSNVMDITVGAGRVQAEIQYETAMVRSFEKAAFWLFKSLGCAGATEAVEKAAAEAKAKAAEASREDEEVAASGEDEEVAASGEGWACTIEKMGDGVFKASLTWTFEAEPADEQMTITDEAA